MLQFTLDQLFLKNFRSYSKETKINFGSRITLLFGKGSVGKTTIVDALQILHASELNNVDLYEKNFKFILSKQNKSNNFSLGIACSNLQGKELVSTRGFIKEFSLDKKEVFYPKSISIYSTKDDPENKNQEVFHKENKFLTISNTPITQNKDKIFKDFVVSNISFIENQFAWRELYEYTLIHKKELIGNLNKCIDFSDKYNHLSEKHKKAKLDKNEELAKDIEAQRNNLFDSEYSPIGFNPGSFPFGGSKNIKKYIEFLEKKTISYNEFIKFISDDTKQVKSFLYKNNKLYGNQELRRLVPDNSRREFFAKLEKTFNKKIPSVRSTFAEFLCVCLTEICVSKSSPSENPEDYYPFVDKDHFKWDIKSGSKVLSPREMLRLCSRDFGPTLSQIKTIRHQENINNFIKNLSHYSSSATIQSEFHDNVELHQRDINKWLSEFGYDFKVSVDRVGIKGQAEIMHKKGSYKIPADLGGSGAQYLLTYLTELIDSNENIILLEEPEKALHSSLQIKLANLFTDISKKNQLVIETHSENLLLGILKQIRDKKIKPEEVSVLYVYMENGVSKIDHLELNEKGGFKSKWRDGFFTEKLDLI